MSDGNCFKCNKPGHFARECPEAPSERGGYGGGRGRGGFSRGRGRGGPSGGGGGGGRDSVCYNCNQPGHMSRDCPEPRNQSNSGYRSTRSCYVCNEEGHISRDCPQGGNQRSSSGVQCYNCQGYGHISRNCPDAAQN